MTAERVLVTGGAGGIGLHLVRRLLDDGHDITVLDNFSTGEYDEDFRQLVDRNRLRVVEHDLATIDPAIMGHTRPHTVYHLAARVGVAHTLQHPYEVLRDNVAMTVKALEIARQAASRRFVFASSSEVYGGSLQAGMLPLPTAETAPIVVPDLSEARPAYMLSKLCGESLTRHSGVPWTILRYHNVYGPRMGHSHVVPELLQRSSLTPDGGELSVRSPDHRRTFCFVTDAVEWTVRAAGATDCEEEVLNIGTGEPEITIRELAVGITETMPQKIHVVGAPPDPGSPPRRQPDIARTEKLTGYRARVSLEDGLATTAAWYGSQGHADA